MATADFRSLCQQFSGQWNVIQQAPSAERRILVAELAKALAEWEAAQTDPLDKIQSLQRVAHWGALASLAAEQIQHIIDQLGQTKPTLQIRLQETYEQIMGGQSRLEKMRDEVEAVCAVLRIAEQELGDLKEKELCFERQLESLHILSRLQDAVDHMKVSVAELEGQLMRGEDPAGLLAEVTSLYDTLLGHYKNYVASNQEIAANMLVMDEHHPVLTSEIGGVPERLVALDQELKKIDQILAEQLQRQDVRDQEIKTRI